MYPNWEHHVDGRQLYYVTGIISCLRLFPNKRIKFLKEEALPSHSKSAVDLAVEAVLKDTDWPNQALFDWDQEVSAAQLRRVRDPRAVGFTKAVHTIVACEFAISALRPDVSRYWVYDYMRIIPAVYNIDDLTQESITEILNAPNSAAQLRLAAGPDGVDVLTDLRDGACVTGETAVKLTNYANDFVLAPKNKKLIGPVRFHPGKNKLGRRGASSNEYIGIR
jgi:hypothetical protein